LGVIKYIEAFRLIFLAIIAHKPNKNYAKLKNVKDSVCGVRH
jgi:hypothetical protein